MKTPFQLFDYFKISIIQDNIENVDRNLRSLLKDMSFTKKVLTDVDFKKVCSTPSLPYNPNPIKFILYEPSTNPGATVFFPNFTEGWFTAIYNYTRINNKSAFQVGFTVGNSVKYPAYYFTFFYNENGQIRERTVHAIKEDKWVFFDSKNPLVIEQTDNYLKKRIRDRINNEIILSYLKKAGYDLKDKNFFKSDQNAILFSH